MSKISRETCRSQPSVESDAGDAECPGAKVTGVFVRNYRVMVQNRDSTVALVCVEETLRAARLVALAIVRKQQARLDDGLVIGTAQGNQPKRVFVQAWVGTPTAGSWQAVNERRGGIDQVLRPSRIVRHGKPSGHFTSGDQVRCVLLDEKTRRGGWRARIAGTAHVGPVVVRGEPPRQWKSGMTVPLRLSSLSRRTGAAQFAVVDQLLAGEPSLACVAETGIGELNSESPRTM
ncbi:hypothetical protein Poly51_56200 [Rubripirellula tenax]|uniref:Uncharacterized protein n=1 Tax=Rubripirellula tenax TaxID=2528015 RepID=A0A5C6ECP6_9BACT|nr:hypothetical protein [Rubripirellula tenax]TWU46224.1 hypothetical protein Poly51_56200 [Rubripirellula tenax]